MWRTIYNWCGGVIAVSFAVMSLLAVIYQKHLPWGLTEDATGKVLVAAWAILPPAFFWIDWVGFCSTLTADERDIAKHTHDLARNIWLGLLGVLSFGFFKLNWS
jgi:hypothetical protein